MFEELRDPRDPRSRCRSRRSRVAPPASRWQGDRHLGPGAAAAKCDVRRAVERCGECAHGGQCANHRACATQRDAALAAEIGAAWAVFVRRQLDIRRPWPPFTGRAAAIALRLVEALAAEPRRSELAQICHWRAGLRWESLELPRIRDRPYEAPDGGGVVYQLPGALRIQFRTRRTDRSGAPSAARARRRS
jgi:hypothetical protein